jgi:hypothetical protein
MGGSQLEKRSCCCRGCHGLVKMVAVLAEGKRKGSEGCWF